MRLLIKASWPYFRAINHTTFNAPHLPCRFRLVREVNPMQRGSKEMFPFANPWSAWWSLGIKTFEMSIAAAEVVTHRSARIASMPIPPGRADRRELGGMV